MAKEQKSNLIIVLVGGLIVLAALGKLPGLGDQAPAAPSAPATPSVPTPAVGCQVEDTSVDLAPQDTFSRGSNVDIEVDYWVDGEYVGKNYSTSGSSELTLSPGNDVVTMATANANGTVNPKLGGTGIGVDLVYYGVKNAYTIPCAGTYVDNLYVYKADQEQEDLFNGTTAAADQSVNGYVIEDLTVSVFDENDQVNADGSNELSIGTNTYAVQVKVKVSSYQYFGNPESDKGIMVCFDADAVNSDTVKEYEHIKVTNYGAQKASVPEFLLGTADWCWELTEITHLKDGETVYLDVELKPDSSDGPDAEDHVGFWLIDTNYYIHTKTGELMGPDWEDNDGTQVGLYSNATSGEGGSNSSIKGEHVMFVTT